MSAFTKLNLIADVEDMAARSGRAEGLEARFARTALELTQHGLTTFRLDPGFRVPFGHTHTQQEEVYVVLEGGLRMNVEGEVVELGRLDALRVGPNVWRGMEAGPDGAFVLVTGAPSTGTRDAELEPGWWPEPAAAEG